MIPVGNGGLETLPLFIAGLFRDRALAERVVTALLDAGVPSGEISFVARELSEQDVTDRGDWAGEDNQFTNLAVHSGWERLGWLGGARPSYRDRIPPNIDMAFLAAGPLAIAIGGAQQGATAGGIVGSMTNFGFTHDTARQWYAKIVDGQAWVMVRTKTKDAEPVRRVFAKYQPEVGAESLRHW